jgi:hypothetical protein
MNDSAKKPEHSSFNLLKVTALIAADAGPDHCVKLLTRLADMIVTGEPIPKEAQQILSAALLRTAANPEDARKFLAPKSGEGRRKQLPESLEVYFRIRDRMESEPDRPLTSSLNREGHFCLHALEISKSEDRVKTAYYAGRAYFKKLIAAYSRQNLKVVNVLPIENARED